DAPCGRRRDPREDLQQRRLARAVAADDAENLALLDVERDVPERPDLLDVCSVLASKQTPTRVGQRLAQGPVGRLVLPEAVLLGDTFGFDDGSHQIVAARLRSCERATASPATRN